MPDEAKACRVCRGALPAGAEQAIGVHIWCIYRAQVTPAWQDRRPGYQKRGAYGEGDAERPPSLD